MTQHSFPPPEGWRAVPVPDPVSAPVDGPPPPAPASTVPAAGPSVVVPGRGDVPLASMVERIMGGIIDALILLIPMQALSWLLPDAIEPLSGVVVSALYIIPLLGLQGVTIGGRVMGIRCITMSGELPGLRRSALRWLALYGVGALPIIGWLLMLIVGLSPLMDGTGRMQGLQDKAAGTYVIKASRVQRDS